jgi:recombinational DNA repair ATPase RecF
MKIAHVRISNILGIEELEFDAGQFNAIQGKNGTGKTSVLEALKSVIGDTETGTLIRAGAEAGEVVLILEDGSQIKRRITAKTNVLSVEKDGVKLAAGSAQVKKWTDAFSVNPIAFLDPDKKRRLNAMIECLPVELDCERLSEISGYKVGADPDDKRSALERIDHLHKTIFEERTGTNRAVREKAATIGQLEATLPTGQSGAVIGDQGALETRLANLDEALTTEMARVDTKLAGLRTASAAKVDGWRAEIDKLHGLIGEEREALATIEGKAGQQREISRNRHAAERAPIADELSTIRASEGAASRAAQTRETIARMRLDLADLEAEAEALTGALDGLNAYKAELLASLPIPGLAVIDGEIYRNGVVFDRLNTAQKVEIAVEIAKLRAGDLSVICVDGIELMDTNHFNEFRKQSLESGMQMFVTRVADGEFGIAN